jgi:hypothetical protein
MTTAQIEKLQARLDQAQGDLEALDRDIPLAVADCADDSALAQMRSKRRDLIDQCDDLSQAIQALQGRRDDAARKAADAEQSVRRGMAAKRADEFLSAADRMDDALAALDRAYAVLEGKQRELATSLRLAGLSDSGRIGTMMKPALRWATWRAAPNFAKGAAVPRAQENRRATMRDALKTLIPRIPVE